MPALWQASQRPMYVRTVWVDGFRHAILSNDDPYYLKLNAKKRRPYSSAAVSSKLLTTDSQLSNYYTDGLEECLKKFNLVVRKERISSRNKQRPKSSKEFEIEKLNLANVDESEDEEFLLKATPQPLNDFESSRSNYNNYNMKNIKTNRTSRVEIKHNTELSERVLQWLDLAGKVDLLEPDKAERMTQPRHSWPEIERRHRDMTKSKNVNVRCKNSAKVYTPKTGDSGNTQQDGTIDRNDFYVPTSANTIENYARQSRNVKYTLGVETNGKTKDIPNNKTKSKEPRLNVVEARQKVVTERSAVEKQYAELVSKKLIPDLGMGTKKQVHIFMPELKKKFHSNATSRTESLLTQKS